MTRASGAGGGGNAGYRRTGANYVRARGGAKGASRAAVAGRAATSRLTGFLSTVVRDGFASAANELGLRAVVGQSADVVFSSLVDAIAPSTGGLEAEAARRAVAVTLEHVFAASGAFETDLAKLNSMTADDVRSATVECVQRYVYYRWLQELGDRIERRAINEKQAIRLERDVWAYIREAIVLDLGKYDVLSIDWRSGEASAVVERIYQEAYGLLEVNV